MEGGTPGISDEDFREILSSMSGWYDRHGYINVLKVLYRDFVTEPDKLYTSSQVIKLFELLCTSGHLSSVDPTVLYDTINILTRPFGLEPEIRKLAMKTFVNIRTVCISKFTHNRQMLIKVIKSLSDNDVKKISQLYNCPLKADRWELFVDLEQRREFCEENLDDFMRKITTHLIRSKDPLALMVTGDMDVATSEACPRTSKGCEQTTLEKDEETLPSAACAAASKPSAMMNDDSLDTYQAHYNRLKQNISSLNMRIRKDVDGDGNCFFYCIQDQLERLGLPGESIPTMRTKLVELLQHLDKEDPLKMHVDEDYLERLEKNGTWVDAVAVRGMSRVLNRNIRIVTSQKESIENGYLINEIKENSNSKDQLLLGLIRESHYISLGDQTPLDNGDKTLPLVAAATSLLSSDFIQLLVQLSDAISKKDEKYVDMLRILYTGLKDMDRIALEEAKSAFDLFQILIGAGFLEQTDISILFETIELTGLIYLKEIIEKYKPYPDEVKITQFSPHCQQVVSLGKGFSSMDLQRVNQLHECSFVSNPWKLIQHLENTYVLTEDKMPSFLQYLRENEVNVDFNQLLVQLSDAISKKDEKYVDMLRILYTDLANFKIELEKAKSAFDLFQILRVAGILKPTDISILFETIKLTGLLYLKEIIQKYETYPDEVEITKFSPHRQHVVALGKGFSFEDIQKVRQTYEVPDKFCSSPWKLITYLENTRIVSEDTLPSFRMNLKSIEGCVGSKKSDETMPLVSPVASTSKGNAIGSQIKDCTIGNCDMKTLPVQVVQSSRPGNQGNQDDIIRDYLLQLTKTVCSKANRFTPGTWNTPFQVDIEHMFTDLDLLKVNKKKQDAKPTTLQDVLEIIKSTPACRVLMEGEGGIGKSTLLRLFASNWANKSDETFKGKLLFLVNIRDIDKSVLDGIMKLIDLEDFEFTTNLEPDSKLIKRFIVKHDHEIVLLLDGLDELKDDQKSPISLFKKEQLKNSKVIITSRSEKIDEFITESDVHVNVKGFNESNIKNYIKKYFEYFEKPALAESLIGELSLMTSVEINYEIVARYTHKEASSMCKNPMLLLTVCTIWDDKKYLPRDKSDLFKQIFQCILNQYIDKDKVQERKISIFEETPPKYIHAMLVLGQCMYESLKRNILSINKDDMEGEEQVVKLALKLGFVYKDASIYKDDFEEVFTPPHKLIVESLVGFYLSKLCKDEHRINQLKPLEGSEWEVIRMNEYLEMARLFAIGFLGAEAGKFLKHWITNNVLTFRPLMRYVDQLNKENRIHVEKTIIDHFSASDLELKPHITDVCYSLRKVIHHFHPNVNANSNFMQLMIKVHDLGRNIIEHLKESAEFIQMYPERLGKIMAYLFIAVEDQYYLLEDNVHLSNEHVVKVLLDEFKKLCFQYDITYLQRNTHTTCHPLLLSHILFNAPNITHIEFDNCNLTGDAMNVISNEYSSGVVLLKLTQLDIDDNDLSAIEGASLASLLVMAPKLEEFYISDCNLSGFAVNDMVRVCSSRGVVLELVHIHIYGNDLSAIEGASLASLLVMAPKLEEFYISDCNLSVVAVNDMVTVCSSRGVVLELRDLRIDGNDLSTIKGDSFASLLVMAPKLLLFDISSCNLSGFAVNDMIRVCSSRGVELELKHLNISKNNLSAIEDASLASLLGMAPGLSQLDVSNCRLSDVVMNDIIKLCSNRVFWLKK